MVYILAKAGCTVLAYLDDYAACAPTKEKALADYNTFLSTTKELGLKLAVDKCQPPVTALEWLGFHIVSQLMTVSIPIKKLAEILGECKTWSDRSRISKHDLQSLVGKLVHLSSAINHGKKFTGRLLACLRAMGDRCWTTLSKEAKLDIKWFLLYAESANGRAIFAPESDYFFIECDASLLGGGGNSAEGYYKWKFSQQHIKKFRAIHELEALNLLVAFKTLAPLHHPRRLTVVLLTDNLASSYALMTRRTKDPTLGACARQMWLEAAREDQQFIIQHKPGHQIPLADALSRYFQNNQKADWADNDVARRGLLECAPVLDGYSFFTASL